MTSDPSSSLTTTRRCGSCSGAPSLSGRIVPVIRRWIRSTRPVSNRTTRYLPRRSTAATISPSSSAATLSGSTGRVTLGSRISTSSNRRPTSTGSWGAPLPAARRFGAGFVAGVNRRERVPRCDAVAALRVADDPDGVVDRVVLDGSARAEVDRRDADGEGAQPRHRAVSGCRDLANDVCLRKRLDGGIAALRADPPLVDIERGAAPERVLNPGPGLVIGDAVAERDEVRGGGDRELGQVGRPVAAERLHRLADLERVSHRAPERLVHVGELADDLTIGAAPELEHRLGELSRVVERLHEGAVADLDVEDDRVRPGRDLLGHDARGDQRDVLDRRRDVAQGVQLLVGGDELRGLADDREADVAHLRDELVGRELDTEARNGLELVERAAGVSETAAAHLPERDAAGRDERPDDERGLVTHPAGRVLVCDRASDRGVKIDRLAALDHRVGQGERLATVQALEVDGHREGRQLIVGNLAPHVAEDELAELLVAELAAVPLALDQFGRSDHFVATKTEGVRRTRIGPATRGTVPDSMTIAST